MDNILVNVSFQQAGRLFFPSICVVCGAAAHPTSIDLCGDCADDLPLNTHACSLCAEPLPASVSSDSICGQCLQKRPKFHASFCAYVYAYPIDHLVRALKFHGRLAYGRVLGELLAVALKKNRSDVWPELIIPMPLANERFRERGFNQAIEIGRIVETRLGIPLRPDLVARTRNTREQTGLDSKARRRNVRGAFVTSKKLSAKHIAIIDDVVTTGSTVNELARVLRRAGTKRIEVWAIARTPR